MNADSQTTILQSYGDKTAIGLSFLCVIHCVFLPILLLLAPANALFWFSDESFHQWMLVAVLISSLLALTLGFQKHKKKSILFWGACGLIILMSSVILGHDIIGELGEKIVTVSGAIVIAVAHLKNYKTCRAKRCDT